jgi:hypothetical protein
MIVGDGLQKIVDLFHVSEALINATKTILNLIEVYLHVIKVCLHLIETGSHRIKPFFNTIESLVCRAETLTHRVDLGSVGILNLRYGQMNLIEYLLDTSKTRIVGHTTIPLMV